MYRISRAGHDPLYFGKTTKNRFDCPWREYGVLYAAETPEGAFIETCILGVDNRLTTGNYRTAQRWSRAFWLHRDQPDGILYCSRFNPSLCCVAIFDRAGAGLSPKDCGALADARNVRFLGEMLDRYDLAL